MTTTPFFPGSVDVGAGRLVDDAHVVAVHRHARAAELAHALLDAVGDRQDRPAALGLPVVVDDRLADRLGDPRGGGLVERLAGQEQGAQARQVVLAQVLRVLLLQHPDRGRRREHRRHLVLLDQAPPDAGIGADRQALVHDRRHAGDQRAVDDVAVADHPADVAGREVGFAGLAAEDVLHARRQRHRVAAGVALHALGPAGRAAGVEGVAGVGGIDPGAGHDGVEMALAQRRVEGVAPGRQRHRRQAAIDQQHLRRLVRRPGDRLVEQRLVGDHLAGAAAGVGADDHFRLGVVDPARQADAGEAAEHHRMDRTDAGAGEHRERRLGDHRHVDQDPVPLGHAELDQDRGHALHLGMQLGEAVDPLAVGFGRDMDQRCLPGPCRKVTIDRVVAEVGRAAGEPAHEGGLAGVADRVERPLPVDERGLFGPEGVPLLERATVEFGEGGHENGSRRHPGHDSALPPSCARAAARRRVAPALRARPGAATRRGRR